MRIRENYKCFIVSSAIVYVFGFFYCLLHFGPHYEHVAHNRTDHSRQQAKAIYVNTAAYSHPGCSCLRFGYDIEGLKKAREAALEDPLSQPAWLLGRYPQHFTSTCSDYATQRGVGQRVVTYSYYVPGTGVQVSETPILRKFLKQLYTRARRIAQVYPGWLMRVYHNVTVADAMSTYYLCRAFCDFPHVDLCQVSDLPTLGDLQSRMPIGRTWRFAALGDPTVSWVMSRDLDSKILDREVEAVKQWWVSGRGFHVMRDHPNHHAVVLAGLWGAYNKLPQQYADARDAMFAQPVNYTEKYDQILLAQHLWPLVKDDALEHDSYNCKDHPGSVPFPTQRQEWTYCGWGPYKSKERQILFLRTCPKSCRPPQHHNWAWC